MSSKKKKTFHDHVPFLLETSNSKQSKGYFAQRRDKDGMTLMGLTDRQQMSELCVNGSWIIDSPNKTRELYVLTWLLGF